MAVGLACEQTLCGECRVITSMGRIIGDEVSQAEEQLIGGLCVPTKVMCSNLIPSMMVLGSEAFGR